MNNTFFYLWPLFGYFMMGMACRSRWDESKIKAILAIIGLIGIYIHGYII